MAESSIPVDLFNPGQVFACLGFLEAAETLLGDAEGGFDWSDKTDVRFRLRSAGHKQPFSAVLEFLAEAEVCRIAPYERRGQPTKEDDAPEEDGDEDEPVSMKMPRLSPEYPAREGDRLALPIRLETADGPGLDVSHWADGSSREAFKLYAGNRSAFGIASAMLSGTHSKPKKNNVRGALKTRGLRTLLEEQRSNLEASPFHVLTALGGTFNLDPRGAWTALDAGYSPDKHQGHAVAASPVVEILAAIGLEHARPDEYERRKVRYAAWLGLLPPLLARPAVAAIGVAVPLRLFRFDLELSGKNKVVTFAQEETSA